ncbi:MAG: hypothetical protein WD894_23465 [Pirellulales bacterium]
MIVIRFPDRDNERRALGFLAGRWSFRVIEDGAVIVREAALGPLAAEGIRFAVEGKARYEQMGPGVRRDISSRGAR